MVETGRRLLAGLIFCAALQAQAQTAAPTTVLIGTPPQPSWSLLSTEQKIILAPLAKEWDNMEYVRRKKWLGIADRFHRLSPEEQARVQQRMREWARLTPEQRARVRDSYKEFNQLPAEKKQAVKQKWETYSNLPAEERPKLKQSTKPADATPADSSPPPATGTAARPDTARSE